MPIHTVEAIVTIKEDRKLVVQLPADVPVGNHRVIAVLDDAPAEADLAANGASAEWTFPVLVCAQWPANMPLTRAEMYDDDGR